MDQSLITRVPQAYDSLVLKSNKIGFSMPSDVYIGSLLKTLIASKPKGNFLELGTGMGLSLSWMVDGMDSQSSLTTVDNDSNLIKIVKAYFENDDRVTIICQDGGDWIEKYQGNRFDLIFADAWPGKYSHLENLLKLIKPGGIYVVDDMLEQPNWPNGHNDNVVRLLEQLEEREDIELTKMEWSTGIVIAVKK